MAGSRSEGMLGREKLALSRGVRYMASPNPDAFWDPYRGPDENSAVFPAVRLSATAG